MNVPDHIQWPAGLDAQAFLDQYWQKKPLLIRNAFANFETPITPDELAGLATEYDTTPRLICKDPGERYTLENGPFDSNRFSELTDNNWSLLVTDVEKHLPDLVSYLQPFSFIPAWRIDDLMISYAPEGASVGAHVDDYDVFLLQASGTRRWMIDSSDKPDLSLDANTELKLLANFNATDTFDLEPGDMLYLPPGVPHHGVAVSADCTTWSVGFRAPSQLDVLSSFTDYLIDGPETQRYSDADLKIGRSGEIDQDALARFEKLWTDACQLSGDQLAHFSGMLVTTISNDIEREVHTFDETTDESWQKHPFSRMAYVGSDSPVTLYADGMAYPGCSRALAQTLCSNQTIMPLSLSPDELAMFRDLAGAGAVVPLD